MDYFKPALAMVGLQLIYAGVNLFTRAALLNGLSSRVFVVYRQGLATLFIVPIAFVSRRRNSSRCPLGLKTFVWILMASLFGVTANQNAYFEGLYLSSSTIASAMNNLIPAITFLITAILGMEKLSIKSLATLAKVLGTIICVSGAISMALIKGPKVLNTELPPSKSFFSPTPENWLLGCLLLFGSSFLWTLWLILQVPISANCPDNLYTSSVMCFLATVESAIVAFVVEKDVEAWRLSSYLELSCCLFSGIALALSFFAQAWCISKTGPLFCAMFNPLCTVIVTIFAAIFLHEETYIGSLVGALAVIIGVYIVLWGKAKDHEESKEEIDPKFNQTNIGQDIIVDSSEKTCKIDLEEPLLSSEPTKKDDDTWINIQN